MCAHHDDVPACMAEGHDDMPVIHDADLHHHEPFHLGGPGESPADEPGPGGAWPDSTLAVGH